MKRNILLIVFFLLGTLSAQPTNRPWKLYGLWQGTSSNGKSLAFLFEKSHVLSIINGKLILGSSGKEVDAPIIHFQTNFQASPKQLDFVLQNGKQKQTIKAIVKFFDDHRILIYSQGKNKPRPKKFNLSDPKNIFILFKNRD